MIGQKHLQSRIEQLIENHTFPRFSILVGPKGSGKKTIVRSVIMGNLTSLSEIGGIKVDEVRQLITDAYKIDSPVIYFIPNADGMSNVAKNALLKVTEEPPNNAYFIMTLEDENNTLETIRSRGTVFHMDRYTPYEIVDYIKSYIPIPEGIDGDKFLLLFTDLCETPGDVQLLASQNAEDFYNYVQLVVDNIAEVSLANAFKIPSKVALKEDAEGYDLRLFWKAFMKVLVDTNRTHDFGAITITSKYLQKLKVKGINRQMLMDNWVLEIRELWQ